MIFLNSASSVNKDATSVVSKGFSNGNCTSNRSSLIDLVNHILLSCNQSEFFNSVDLCSFLSPASSVGKTVSALNISTASNSVIMAKSLIGGAGLISDIIMVDPFISVFSVTSIASIIRGFTRNEDLWGEIDVWPLCISSDFNTI